MGLTQTWLDVLAELEASTKDDPVTRRRLKELTHLSDRENREIIGGLRDAGNWIIGGPVHGYYMARSRAELIAWLDQYASYAYTIIARRNRMLEVKNE